MNLSFPDASSCDLYYFAFLNLLQRDMMNGTTSISANPGYPKEPHSSKLQDLTLRRRILKQVWILIESSKWVLTENQTMHNLLT